MAPRAAELGAFRPRRARAAAANQKPTGSISGAYNGNGYNVGAGAGGSIESDRAELRANAFSSMGFLSGLPLAADRIRQRPPRRAHTCRHRRRTIAVQLIVSIEQPAQLSRSRRLMDRNSRTSSQVRAIAYTPLYSDFSLLAIQIRHGRRGRHERSARSEKRPINNGFNCSLRRARSSRRRQRRHARSSRRVRRRSYAIRTRALIDEPRSA